MEKLIRNVLKNKLLWKAGELFHVEDAFIEPYLYELLEAVKQLIISPGYEHSINDQNVAEISLARSIAAIKSSKHLDHHVGKLIEILQCCLNFRLNPVDNTIPAHAKIASDILSYFYLNYSRLSSLDNFLKTAVQFLFCGNASIVENFSCFFSLVLENNLHVVSEHVGAILESIMNYGNHVLVPTLVQLLKVDDSRLISNNLKHLLLSSVHGGGHAARSSLLEVVSLVYEDDPQIVEGCLKKLIDLLSFSSSVRATINILSEMFWTNQRVFYYHVTGLMQIGLAASTEDFDLIGSLLVSICSTDEALAKDCLVYLTACLFHKTSNLAIIFAWIETLLRKYPCHRPVMRDMVQHLDNESETTEFSLSVIASLKQIAEKCSLQNSVGHERSSTANVGDPQKQFEADVDRSEAFGNNSVRVDGEDCLSTSECTDCGDAGIETTVDHANNEDVGVHALTDELESGRNMPSGPTLPEAVDCNTVLSNDDDDDDDVKGSLCFQSDKLCRHLNDVALPSEDSAADEEGGSDAMDAASQESESCVKFGGEGSNCTNVTEMLVTNYCSEDVVISSSQIQPSVDRDDLQSSTEVDVKESSLGDDIIVVDVGRCFPTSGGNIEEPHEIKKDRFLSDLSSQSEIFRKSSGIAAAAAAAAAAARKEMLMSRSASLLAGTDSKSTLTPDNLDLYCDGHRQEIRNFLGSLLLKMPLPLDVVVSDGNRSHQKYFLEFCCPSGYRGCVFAEESGFRLETRHAQTWLHIMFLKNSDPVCNASHERGRSPIDKSDSGNAPPCCSKHQHQLKMTKKIRSAWNLAADKKSFDKTIATGLPSKKELSKLMKEMNDDRCFDLFSYAEECGGWVCFVCKSKSLSHAYVRGDGSPSIEGLLKEKSGYLKFLKPWKLRRFLIDGFNLSYLRNDQSVTFEEITKLKAKDHSLLLSKYTTVSLTAVKGRNSSIGYYGDGCVDRPKKKKLTLRFFDQKEATTWIRCLYIVMTKFHNVSDNLGLYLVSE